LAEILPADLVRVLKPVSVKVTRQKFQKKRIERLGFCILDFSGLTYLMTVSTVQKIQKRIFISKEKGFGWATCDTSRHKIPLQPVMAEGTIVG